MTTIILPSEPDASKGKYYRLDRCEKGKIIFEEELSPKARIPYIRVPKEDGKIVAKITIKPDISHFIEEKCVKNHTFR